MRALIGPHAGTGDLTDDQLAEIYAPPSTPWLRVNMISTVDGSATGDSGKSGSINNAPDKRVFDLLRGLADAIVVGAGTARIEGYQPVDKPTVVVSRHAAVPEQLRGGAPGLVHMATHGGAECLEEARTLLGNENVHVLGSHRVDLAALKDRLGQLGFTHLLSEGGPHLLGIAPREQEGDGLRLRRP